MDPKDGAGARGQQNAGALTPPASPRARVLASATLVVILVVAAVLRFEGLAWGLPNARHWFSYHPDEILVLGAAARVNLFAGRLDPGFFNYGSFLIYVISVTTQVLDAYAPLQAPYHIIARMTLVGRAWVALFGVGTVYMAWLIGRRLGGTRAGLYAAAIMALWPMHAVHSHFVTVDVPAAFWVSVALYNALRWPEGKRAALWCGIAAGLAAGTKYNSGLVLLAGWAAAWLAPDIAKARRWRATGVMTGAAVLAFLLSTPGILLDSAAFLRDFGYEAHHVETGHGLVFVNTGPGFWYHLSTNLYQGTGPFLALAALAALIALAWRRRTTLRLSALSPQPSALLAFALPYFLIISLAAVRFQRYDIPLLPVLAAGLGCLFATWKRGWLDIPAAGLIGTLILAQGQVSTMSAPLGEIQMTVQQFHADPRDAVLAFFDGIPAGATIGVTRTPPWFYSPPFSPANGGPQVEGMYQEQVGKMRFRLVTPDADGQTAYTAWPDFFVISDYEYGDPLRLEGATVPERAAQMALSPLRPDVPPEADRIARLWNNVMGRYTMVGIWTPTPHAFGLTWGKRRLPPHDSFYSYPTLIVFRRKP